MIAQKRAEVAAKLASMKNLAAGGSKPAGSVAAPQPIRANATLPAKPTAASTPGTPGTPGASDDLARRIAEAKRLVASAQSKLANKDNPYMVRIEPVVDNKTCIDMQSGCRAVKQEEGTSGA